MPAEDDLPISMKVGDFRSKAHDRVSAAADGEVTFIENDRRPIAVLLSVGNDGKIEIPAGIPHRVLMPVIYDKVAYLNGWNACKSGKRSKPPEQGWSKLDYEDGYRDANEGRECRVREHFDARLIK